MQVTLRVTDGPAAGRHTHLGPGQALNVGRSGQADFAVPNDLLMSRHHFEFICDETECRVRDLGSSSRTFVNGTEVSEALVHDGDELTAGQTTFCVSIEATSAVANTAGEEMAERSTATDPNVAARSSVLTEKHGFLAPTATAICQFVQFEEEQAAELLTDDQTPEQFVQLLAKNKFYRDAVRFLAHALTKRDAVWWSCQCVRNALGDDVPQKDAAALKVTEQWVIAPSEENRRAAMPAAELLEHGTAASWAAMGAFWSSGSMAPPDAPAVPPGDDLTPQAVAGAVMLAAVGQQPENAPGKYQNFLELGIAVAKGQQVWKHQ